MGTSVSPLEEAQKTLKDAFGMSDADIAAAGKLSDEDLAQAYTMMYKWQGVQVESGLTVLEFRAYR